MTNNTSMDVNISPTFQVDFQRKRDMPCHMLQLGIGSAIIRTGQWLFYLNSYAFAFFAAIGLNAQMI
jgi:hypothetical protein